MNEPTEPTTDRVPITIELPGITVKGRVTPEGAAILKANAERLAVGESPVAESRPTPTPTPNVEGQPAEPTAEGNPATPNPEHKPTTPNRPPPIPGRGAVTQRLRRQKQTRQAFAERRYPGISAKDAQKVCIVRLDFQEKVYGKRGKVRGG